MFLRWSNHRILRLLTATATPLLMGSTGLTTNLDQRVLAAHNRERAATGTPPLRWDAGLAASAKAWAEHLAAASRFEHAPENPTTPEGENLWAGTKDHYSAEAMVDAWIREKRYFKRGKFPNNSVTGRVADIGHYTQVVWRDTGQVGCAMAKGRAEDILVCRYSDAGNYEGEVPF
ncbi:CAP domain-containing protein [Sphingomonas sp. M1-B02]|uniref:CAP domain-containing protein n=1 Tax=Sphingomonas sp. M1-B02 TaxID=3114300 RepID=UPI0022408316|nr:CAP domain-containing protein [Sphingomonas sp. S6-11]UZK67723.1 CAP domain-containing protein [Sphingomonas sp. S6-11]